MNKNNNNESSDDTGSREYWRDIEQFKRERKLANKERCSDFLRAAGVQWKTFNNGHHWVIRHNGVTIDFWPSRIIWNVRGVKRGYGTDGLCKYLGIAKPDHIQMATDSRPARETFKVTTRISSATK